MILDSTDLLDLFLDTLFGVWSATIACCLLLPCEGKASFFLGFHRVSTSVSTFWNRFQLRSQLFETGFKKLKPRFQVSTRSQLGLNSVSTRSQKSKLKPCQFILKHGSVEGVGSVSWKIDSCLSFLQVVNGKSQSTTEGLQCRRFRSQNCKKHFSFNYNEYFQYIILCPQKGKNTFELS